MSVFTLLLATQNCRKETDYTNRLTNSSGAFFEKDKIILGKQLENPYSVENMQEAYNNIKGKEQRENGGNLNPTHLYIRYLPANEAELQILQADEDLELFDYPLDYEMEEGGISYHDPNLPDSVITWQYTAVEIGYTFASVEYEILDSLIIPEFYEEESFTPEFLDQLEREAFKITGNLKEGMVFSHNAEALPQKWTPKGKIQIYDDIIKSPANNGLIPLEGVKVRARSWFKIKTVYTEPDGSFQTDQFRWDVYYSIKWETTEYFIRNGRFNQAYYNGPKKTGDWDLDIINGGWKSLRFGTIHRAAHRYYYGDIDGLKRPGNSLKKIFKYIDAINSPVYIPGTSIPLHKGGYSAINNGTIKIWKGVPTTSMPSGRIAPTDEIFSTTIHEIAHTAHIKLIGLITFGNSDGIIRESWANAVEWHLTKLEYIALGKTYYDTPETTLSRDNLQRWDNFGNDYSPIFIDLVDDFNQALQSKVYNASTKSWSYPNQYCKLGSMDGTGNCYIETAPANTTAHIKTNNNNGTYALYFYYTPIGCCTCPLPQSNLNASHHCRMFPQLLPRDVVPFVVDSKVMYIKPTGADNYPFDEFSGLTMSYIETNILPNVRDMQDLTTEIYNHRPSNTNPNVITNLLKLYP